MSRRATFSEVDPRAWPLIGRQTELDRALSSLSDSTTAGVVIVGAPGVGKSRLAEETLDRVRSEGAVAVGLIATPGTSDIPFGCLAHLLDGPPSRRLDGPDLLGALRAVRDRLHRAADGRALVVAIDDAQHLDEASASLTLQLAIAGEARLLLTVRAGAPTPTDVTALWKDGWCRRHDLQPLDRRTTAEFATTVVGGPLSQASIDELHAISEGNPLFLRELLWEATANDALHLERGLWHWQGVTGSVRLTELVESHLGRLEGVERDLVDVIAVGEPLPLCVLAELGDERTVLALESAGLLHVGAVDHHDQQPLVRLTHPLFGEARRRALGVMATRSIEGRLVAALSRPENLTEPDRLRVARWSLSSGCPLSGSDLLDAARRAATLADIALTAQLAEAASRAGAGAEADLELAEALEGLGQEQQVSATLRGLAERLERDEHRARALCLAVRVLASTGDLAGARTAAEKADSITDPTWRGFVEAQWATTLVVTGHIEEARPLTDALDDHGDPRVRLRALSASNLVAVADGRLQSAYERTSSCIAPALELRGELPRAVAWVFSAMTLDLLAMGRLGEIDRILELAAGDTTAANPTSRGFHLLLRARVQLARGQALDARTAAAEAAGSITGIDELGLAPLALGTLAEACGLAGDPAAATADHEAGALTSDDRMIFASEIARARAWACMADQDVAATRARLVAAADVAASIGMRTSEATALFDAVRLDAPRAVRHRLLSVATEVDGPLALAWCEHARALDHDDPGALEASATGFEQLGYALVAAEACALAARRFHDLGITAGARRCSLRSLTLRRALGGSTTLALDLPSGLPALSEREAQVARLAAGGQTSREIAEALSVSKRTIDNQLSSVYQKLGITGRHELADVLDR